jgi:hypothetical protein
MKPVGLTRWSGRNHQRIILAAQVVGSAAFPVDRHERTLLLSRSAALPLFLMLALFRGLPLASFPLPDPVTLTLFRRLAETGSPLACQFTLTLFRALLLPSILLARTLAFLLFGRLLLSELPLPLPVTLGPVFYGALVIHRIFVSQ